MNTTTAPRHDPSATPPRRLALRVIVVWLVGVSILSAVAAVPYAVITSLRLERGTVRLREAVTGAFAESGGWSKRIEIRLGDTLFGLARLLSRFTDLPDEARLGLQAARSAEIGVYQWRGADLARTHRMMTGTGAVSAGGRDWTRVVTVHEGDESVAVFTPAAAGRESDPVEMCVVVLSDRELIVVSLKVDPAPLVELVRPHLHELQIDCERPVKELGADDHMKVDTSRGKRAAAFAAHAFLL